MNNIVNLGATQTAPAIQGLAGQTASPGDNSSLFSALLMQQMGPDLSGAGNTQIAPGLGQGLSGVADLAKLLPGLVAQSKDSKLTMPVNRQTDNPVDGPETNPVMAMWLASMAAAQIQPNAQTQPNTQNPAAQLSGLSAQPASAGLDQNAALLALEQQFPGLALALREKHLVDAKPQAGKANIEATGPAVSKADQDPTDVKTSDVNIPDVKPADVKNDFSAALNVSHIAEPTKVDAPQAPVHVNTDVTAATAKVADVSAKSKVDQKDLAANAAVKDNQPAVVQVTPQNQSADAKPQSQDQPQSDDSRTGNQTKKDPTSTTQIEPAPAQANSSAGAGTTSVDPTNFAAMAQSTAHSAPASASNHQSNSAAPQAVNVRDVSAVAGADPAPRIVHAARLMEAAGQAEMRVSLKSDASGTVDVRAMLENGNISATVAAQHGGTRDWMMANMHELHTSLSRDDLNLKTFEVTDAGLQNNGRDDEPKQQQEPQQQQRNAAYSNFVSETHSTTTTFDDVDSPETTSRALSLLA
jgi:Flagellar hook-length control protein FliK